MGFFLTPHTVAHYATGSPAVILFLLIPFRSRRGRQNMEFYVTLRFYQAVAQNRLPLWFTGDDAARFPKTLARFPARFGGRQRKLPAGRARHPLRSPRAGDRRQGNVFLFPGRADPPPPAS